MTRCQYSEATAAPTGPSGHFGTSALHLLGARCALRVDRQEPLCGGPLNEVIRLFNDEGIVRAAAQAAERFFEVPPSNAEFAGSEQRMMRPRFADHRIDNANHADVGAVFTPRLMADGAHSTLPLHVRVLRNWH